MHSFLFGTAWRCVPNLLPRKGEHFLCPSPAGRSTILNALRVALRIISGKYIFNLQFWKICGFSRIAFSRVGFRHEPSQASRFARCQLPRRGSFLGGVGERSEPEEVHAKEPLYKKYSGSYFMQSVLGFYCCWAALWLPEPEWRRGGSG